MNGTAAWWSGDKLYHIECELERDQSPLMSISSGVNPPQSVG